MTHDRKKKRGDPTIKLEARLARGPLSVEETLTVGVALAAELNECSQSAVARREIHPETILVGGDPVTEVALAAAPGQPDARDVKERRARYMTPEQGGLIHRDVDQRAHL